MFGLKADWSLEVHERYFTLGDYAGGEARWCPGCGDHGVLTAVQRLCRDEQASPCESKGIAARFGKVTRESRGRRTRSPERC